MQTFKILLIDDEINVCRGCKRLFEEKGYEMDTALSGREGLEKAYAEDFDLMITDWKIPDINGMDIIKEAKKEKPDMPIIMITGYGKVSTAVDAVKIGADDYIPKPFEPEEIINAVQDIIKKTKLPQTQKKTTSMNQSIIDKEQVLEVLNRTSHDQAFWLELIENGSKALKNYQMSSAAKAAIISGDINWIKTNVGELTDIQLRYLLHRLEMECW